MELNSSLLAIIFCSSLRAAVVTAGRHLSFSSSTYQQRFSSTLLQGPLARGKSDNSREKDSGREMKKHPALSPWEREMMANLKAKKSAEIKKGPALVGGAEKSRDKKSRGGNAEVAPIRGHNVDGRSVDENEFQRDAEHAGKRNNIKLYNRLITKYGKLHASDKCQILFDQAAASGGCELNEFTWGCLINAFSRCGNSSKAEQLLRDFLAQHPQDAVNPVLFTSVIKALSNDGKLAAAVSWLRRLQSAVEKCGGGAGAGRTGRGEGEGADVEDEVETERAYGAILRGCVRCGESQVRL